MTIDAVMRLSGVIPVVTIGDPKHARPIAEALRDGAIRVIEVTLRTAAAVEVIQEMSAVEGVTVGAGTLLTSKQMDEAAKAGARFMVSPGLNEPLARHAFASGYPFLPGVATASDIMRGLDMGIDRFKFFPAEAAGGIEALKALAAPFKSCRFCPTGGISQANAADWLALPSVLCVGGSWLVPSGLPDLEKVRRDAIAASGLFRSANDEAEQPAH